MENAIRPNALGYAQKKIMQSNIYYLFYNQWNHSAKYNNCFA